jgi:hypothetical protein
VKRASASHRQFADGTIVVTTPTGDSYATRPGIGLLSTEWAADTPAPPSTAAPPGAHRTRMMPERKRTRAQARADRIRAERALNDAHVAERNTLPPY